MANTRKRIRFFDDHNSVNAHTRRDMILQQLRTDGKLWLCDCVSEPCFNAFITHHCHFSQMMSSGQRLSDSHPQADRPQVDVIQQLRKEVAQVQIGAESLVDNSEALEHHEKQVDNRSQLDCMVGLTHDDNTSTSTGWTTVKYKSRSRGQMPPPSHNLHKPFCGRVRARAMGQESDNQSISLIGHPADNSIQSGMSDVSQSVDCLGSVYND